MKISLYIYDPYPEIGGADATIWKFIDSLDFHKYELTYFSLRPAKRINKKINYIIIQSNSVFF